jgi:ABC-type bacteriocin/lantibiotic exporters, contain an N-terminal double-glycine peptidase domain
MNKLKDAVNIIKFIYKSEPLYVIMSFPQVLFRTFLTLINIYFPKLIIEAITARTGFTDVFRVVVIYISLLIISNLADILLKNRCKYYLEKLTNNFQMNIGKISMETELKNIESAEYMNMLQLSKNVVSISSSVDLIKNICENIISLICIGYLIVRLNAMFLLIVVFTVAVKTILTYITQRYYNSMRTLEAENYRLGDYLFDLAYFNGGAAKEIRLNGIRNWYIEKLKIFRETMVKYQLKGFKIYTIFAIIGIFVTAGQMALILIILVIQYMDKLITLGDFTMYFNAVNSLTEILTSFTQNVADYNQKLINFDDYNKIINSDVIFANKGNIPEKFDITFENVSFKYPNTKDEKYILENINLTIHAGEKLAVIGVNGAGKTTLVKLLCKFYRPTSGVIKIGGKDIWDISNEEYYTCLTAVFQDFQNLAFTIKENITLTEDYTDLQALDEISEKAGILDVVNNLPDKYETFLSKQFSEGGIDLSGGQGQKLAIARSLFKNTRILILDEPTASLDPIAENEIYTKFLEITDTRTAIFISHRLAITSFADNIIVINGGTISEQGTHDSLMSDKGVYYEMYTKQSDNYS